MALNRTGYIFVHRTQGDVVMVMLHLCYYLDVLALVLYILFTTLRYIYICPLGTPKKLYKSLYLSPLLSDHTV
jgi:hypothetical protein